MIVMHHNVGVTWPDKSQEKRVINFVCYGEENGYSAMAKTVGLTTAIATKMVLDGKLLSLEGKKIFSSKWIISLFDKSNPNDSDTQQMVYFTFKKPGFTI